MKKIIRCTVSASLLMLSLRAAGIEDDLNILAAELKELTKAIAGGIIKPIEIIPVKREKRKNLFFQLINQSRLFCRLLKKVILR